MYACIYTHLIYTLNFALTDMYINMCVCIRIDTRLSVCSGIFMCESIHVVKWVSFNFSCLGVFGPGLKIMCYLHFLVLIHFSMVVVACVFQINGDSWISEKSL